MKLKVPKTERRKSKDSKAARVLRITLVTVIVVLVVGLAGLHLFSTIFGNKTLAIGDELVTSVVTPVQNGFSSVFFGTKAEALAYCRGRFLDADGKAV